jgi:hypothetical protein
VISHAFELEHREIGRRTFDLLQADDIRLRLLEPGEKDRQPHGDRVDVERGDLHPQASRLFSDKT